MILIQLKRKLPWNTKKYSFRMRLVRLVRSARIMFYHAQYKQLCKMGTYRNYVAAAHNDDPLHFLSQRYYLAKTMSLRQRIKCMLMHYAFEESTFKPSYKQAIYDVGFLPLWSRQVDGVNFTLRLSNEWREHSEGEMTIVLHANDIRLHCISFNWISGKLVGLGSSIIPFIGRNQGHCADEEEGLVLFERAFPHNSPSFFCFAGMRGIASAISATHVVAVSATMQIVARGSKGQHFGNTYDGFWQRLGGVPLSCGAFAIPVEASSKALSEVPAKHRKRTATRRAHWEEIRSATHEALRSIMISTHNQGDRKDVFENLGVPVTPRFTSTEFAVLNAYSIE